MPELPTEKEKRFVEKYGLTTQQATILAGSVKLAEYFEKAVGVGKDKKITATQIANFIINKNPSLRSGTFPSVESEGRKIDEMIQEILNKTVGIVSDDIELEKLAKQSIEENPKSAADYKSGKENAIQALIGGVMRLSKGKADAAMLTAILKDLLK